MILDFSNQHHSLLLTLVAVKVSWPFQLSRLKPLESFCTLVFLLRHFQFVSKSYWPYIQNVFQVQPLLTNTGSTLIQVTVSLLLIISVVFHWSLCSCLCFPVIYSQYSGLGDPVRTFRSCYSSAQHLSLAYRSTQSKIQCLSQPPICGPLPSDPPFYSLFPSPHSLHYDLTDHLAISQAYQACSQLRIFHSLFHLMSMWFPQISTWMAPSPAAGLCSDATFSVSLPDHPLSPPTMALAISLPCVTFL